VYSIRTHSDNITLAVYQKENKKKIVIMGQTTSVPNIIPDAVDSIQFEFKKQAQILSEIGNLSYEDFQKCLTDLNSLYVFLVILSIRSA
jgi:hypothetical protein